MGYHARQHVQAFMMRYHSNEYNTRHHNSVGNMRGSQKVLRSNSKTYSVPAGPAHPATPKDKWCLLKASVRQDIRIGDQVEQQIHTLDSSLREEQNGTPLLPWFPVYAEASHDKL
jgi:hypothetical protein